MRSKTTVANDGADDTNRQLDGVRFERPIQKKIEQLARIIAKSEDLTYEIGEICNDIIAKIGISYGGGTLKSIAAQVNCSERHLRRCWDFYKIMSNPAYKTVDVVELRKVKKSAIYELGRIINSDLAEADKQKLINGFAQKTVVEKWTADVLKDRVVNELRRLEKCQNEPEASSKPPPSDEVPAADEIHGDDLILYAEGIDKYVSPARIKSGALTMQSEIKGYRRLLESVVDAAEKLAPNVHDKDIGRFFVDQSIVLKKVGEAIIKNQDGG